MTRAAYEYKQIVPSVVVSALMGALALACASVVIAVLPMDGWSQPSDQPIHLLGYSLLRAMWQESYPYLVTDVFDNGLGVAVAWRLIAAACALTIGLVIGFAVTHAATPLTDSREPLDGEQLLIGKPATSAARVAMLRLRQLRERPIQLTHDVPYPRLWRVLNLLIVGAIGSGKTRLILYLLDQLLSQIRSGGGDHALLVHDTTGEILDGLPLPDGAFAALHPHRPGGYGWAMHRDLLTVEDIEEVADQAVASTDETMWGKGASALAAGCMMASRAKKETWGMPEVYATAMSSPEQMKADFEHAYPAAAALIEIGPDGEISRTTVSLLLTFRASVLRTLRPLAQAWSDLPTERQFSFRDWAQNKGTQPRTVILQRSGRHPAMSALWIGMVVDAIASHVGDPEFPVSQTRTRTLVLDELPVLGRLRKLPELLNTGRNKGLCTIAAVQDLEQLEIAYGDEAKVLKRRFRLKVICAQTPGPELRELSETLIGKRRVIHRRYTKTVTTGAQGSSSQTSVQERVDEIPIVNEHHLVRKLGVHGQSVRAVLVGLDAVVQLHWPLRIWPKQR